MWPYENLAARAHLFESLALSEDPGLKRSAELFLALLPFPRQWNRLVRSVTAFPEDPEIHALLEHERDTVGRKIAKKSTKTLKLRHFCQILKRPNLPSEKGVLRIFSLPYLFAHPGLLSRIGKEYLLYVEPAAGVVFRHTWMRIFATLDDPVLFGFASGEDASFVTSQSNTAATHLAHGDYLDPDETVPGQVEKTHDMVFNGTFDEQARKRHRLMLELMTHPLLENTTALFLGRGSEENIASFKEAAKSLGVEKRVTVVANIRRKTVPEHLARCRIGVHLALHENGCRAVFEFFRSDLPCVVASSMAGINFATVNSQTGAAAMDGELPKVIRETLDNRDTFAPRRWLMEKSGSIISSNRLNTLLKELFRDLGHAWTADIVPLSSSGANRYLRNSDYQDFLPEFRRLKGMFESVSDLPVRISEE